LIIQLTQNNTTDGVKWYLVLVIQV